MTAAPATAHVASISMPVRIATTAAKGWRTPAAPRPVPADGLGGATGLVEALGTRSMVARGTSIFFDGDRTENYYRIASGAVELVKLLPDGRRQIADFPVVGDFFGFAAGNRHNTSAEALNDAIIVRYPRHMIDSLVRTQPGIAAWLVDRLSASLSAAQTQMLLLGRKTARERLASFLLQYASRLELAGSRWQPLHLPMRRVDIADYLGLTEETVSRTFTALRDEGAIETARPDGIRFRDSALLEQLAEAA